MCVRESLRLHSPVQAVTRKYTQDLALPGGCTVPRGENKYKLVSQHACVPQELTLVKTKRNLITIIIWVGFVGFLAFFRLLLFRGLKFDRLTRSEKLLLNRF